MKTLQLGLDWFPERAGGLPRYYYDLVNLAPQAGIEISGLVAGSPSVETDSGGAVRSFAPISAPLPLRLLKARQAVKATVSSVRPDLVASHFALYTLPALGTFDCPLVVHFHGPWATESAVEGQKGFRQRAKLALEGMVYSRASRFIVLSNAFADVLEKQFKVDRDRIKVVPGGIDASRFSIGLSRAEARERLGWPKERRIVLAVRRLVRRMGLENLVKAMRTVVALHPDVLLLIGGRGPLADTLAAAIDAEGLRDNVKLLGFLPNDDLPLAYRAADLSIVPTLALEGFGLIAAESLAAGTPVIVTPVGGLPEVVQGLDASLVLPGSRPEDIAARLDEVFSGQRTLPEADQCRDYAIEQFDWSRVIPKIKAIYQEVLSEKR